MVNMSLEDKVEKAIKETCKEFRENPADFNVEKSFQSYLKNRLMSSISPERAMVTDTNSENVNREEVKKTLKKVENISRVREEGQIKEVGVKGAIDLFVLNPETGFYMKPAKKYRKKDVDAAIELKFLKAAASIGDSKEKEIRSQIERLNSLNSSTKKFFVVFAIKDVFANQRDLLEDLNESLNGRFYYQHTLRRNCLI